MKFLRVVLLTGSLFFILSCSHRNQNNLSGDLVRNPVSLHNSDSTQSPVIKFETIEHDFGRVFAGEKVSYSFKFYNKGKSDLLITNVSASCGCTVPEWPRTPIAPGQEGYITVTFNTAGRNGFQQKQITVLTNAVPNTAILMIKAMVYEPGRETE
ncbi:MAG TPA: DUF1573 domain-containing protein [Bacteroidales bacterium]|jgi:hypothetical protein|nr:DUF1573 domain-containing protein [Bacteroidales bacterium]